MTEAVDVMHMGRDRVICAYLVDGLIVDPGPASSVDRVLAALGEEEPRALMLTHIHLDHAGATGVLVRRFPRLRVYVHERGAPHLVDPSRLLRSAGRLYGEAMEALWGEVAPVPEQNVVALSGGETVEGMRVEYTPGHASHHVAYLHEASGDAFVGDVGGCRIPPSEFTVPPTPPPDIDLDAWRASLDLVESWRPAALCLTHFGRHADASAQLQRVRDWLTYWGQRAKVLDETAFVAELRALAADAQDAEAAASLFQAAPPEQLYAGLARYWAKVAA